MDEILIDEKKYVSSKQAAKMTGYAKDYIGQLCREGKVSARLVGRSWYVLETAIKDHRFGTEIPPNGDPLATPSATTVPSWTNEPARYKVVSDDPLPTTINHLNNNDVEENSVEDVGIRAQINLQDSWKEWFDRIGNATRSHLQSDTTATTPPEPEREPEEQAPEVNEDEEVNVPIHAIYQAPPKELLPYYARNTLTEEPTRGFEGELSAKVGEESLGKAKVIKLIATILAILSVAIAAIGSGYFDKFIISFNQVSAISGVSVYNK